MHTLPITVAARRAGGFRLSTDAVWRISVELRRRKHGEQHEGELREHERAAQRVATQRAEDVKRAADYRRQKEQWFASSRVDVGPTTKLPFKQDALSKHAQYFELTSDPPNIVLPGGCVLEVGVEYCTARRPSRNGSLRGSSEAYAQHFEHLKALLKRMCQASGAGLHILVNEVGLQDFNIHDEEASLALALGAVTSNFAAGALRPSSAGLIRSTAACSGASTPSTSRPASPPSSPRAFAPRIGAFEVRVLMRAPHDDGFDRMFGPMAVYSKLQSGHWPKHDKLASIISERVQTMVEQYNSNLLLLSSPPAAADERADEPPSNSSVANRSSWAVAWTRLDELSGVTPPPDHQFAVRIEYCTAIRPSTFGHLRGSSKTYVDHFEHVRRLVESLLPSAVILVNCNEAEGIRFSFPKAGAMASARAASGCSLSLPTPIRTFKRPEPKGSQTPELSTWKKYTGSPPRNSLSEQPSVPRIGSFEVDILLQGPRGTTKYGPLPIFSKLAESHWPAHDKLLVELHRQAMSCITLARAPGGSAYASAPA